MNPARERALALGLLVVGAALMLFAGGREWFSGRAVADGLPAIPFQVSGRDVAPVVGAVGLLALAGAGVLLLVGPAVRRVVAGVVLVGAVAASARCVDVLTNGLPTSIVRRELESVTAGSETVVTHTAWPWVALAGSLLVVAGGAVVLVRAGRWPGRTSRYDALPQQSGKASAAPVDPADELWKALDRGEDPTADPPADAPGDASRS